MMHFPQLLEALSSLSIPCLCVITLHKSKQYIGIKLLTTICNIFFSLWRTLIFNWKHPILLILQKDRIWPLISERSLLFCGSGLKSQELVPIALEDSYCKYRIIEMWMGLMGVFEVSPTAGEARPQPFAPWRCDTLPFPTFASWSTFWWDGWEGIIYCWEGNYKYNITNMLC